MTVFVVVAHLVHDCVEVAHNVHEDVDTNEVVLPRARAL